MMTSTKPLKPGGFEILGETSDSDCLWSLFGIIPITSGNSLAGAVRGAISKKAGADAMVQVTADWFYQNWIVISRTCTQVDGIAVRSSDAK